MTSAKRPREAEAIGSDEDMELFSDESSIGSPTPPSTEPDVPTKRQQLDGFGAASSATPIIKCSLPPHGELTFPTYDAYEIHYEQTHLNRCLECHKNFPSEHYLNLHIAENHDPIVAVKRDGCERTFGCFVADCERYCSTAQKRRMHLIDKHGFPKMYDFFVVNDGIDRRTSLLRQPGQSHKQRHRPKSSVAEKSGDSTAREVEVEDLADKMSALKFVPRNVRFGKGASKTFTR